MRFQKLTTLVLFAAIFAVALVWMPAQAVPRQQVVLEHFTNTSCGPCATNNPQLHTAMNMVTRDTCIKISYHTWWPGPGDPFYVWNIPDNTGRTTLYGIQGVPSIRIEGIIDPAYPFNVNNIRSHVRQRHAIPSPCTIENLEGLALSQSSVHVTGTLVAEEDITSYKLFLVLISDHISYSSPPGSNGETEFPDPFRDIFPNTSQGMTITATPGNPMDFEGTLNRDPSWDPENLTVVAFVQNMSGREIQQGTWTEVVQNYALATESYEPRQRMVDPAGGSLEYVIYAENLGAMNDIYTVSLEGAFPEGWTHSVEADGVPADPNSIDVPVTSHDTAIITVRVNPNGNPGAAEFSANFTSANEPLVVAEENFRIMGGLDILIVDDDDGDAFETYFESALGDDYYSNYVIGRWDLYMDFLDENQLGDIDAIIWFTGDSFQDGETLTPLDQLMLGDYLNGGGKLFLSGQGIGFDIRTDQFMADILHAQYAGPFPSGQLLFGVDENPISDGMTFWLTGGDGADNQNRQYKVNPLDDAATSMLVYDGDTPENAALLIETDDYRIVYLAFGLEGVADQATRETLMGRGLGWLLGTLAAGDEPDIAVPNDFELGQNFPNPFNPETTIPYALPERSMVTLSIYDVLGREVGQLVSGLHDAGSYSINWNAADLSSGIYFYTLKAVNENSNFHGTRKLVLMK